MGGQPYIYDPPSHRYSALVPQNEFNPKAVTQASLAPPPPPKPKQEGPLLNFNRHPDSYLVLPYGNTTAVPMSANTKGKVKWARYIQLVFRAAQLIGAVGMLICVICLKGMSDNEGWILRLPVCGFHFCRAHGHANLTPVSSLLSTSYSVSTLSIISCVPLKAGRRLALQATTSSLSSWIPASCMYYHDNVQTAPITTSSFFVLACPSSRSSDCYPSGDPE
jgi:hypothetical protein